MCRDSVRKSVMHACRLPVCIFLLGAACGPDFAAAQEPRVMAELQAYVGARSVIDLSPEELLAAYPELSKRIDFTDEQKELQDLLKKVGANVDEFFHYLPNTASVEEVRQQVIGSNGRVIDTARGKYNYLMLTDMRRGIGLDEVRTDPSGRESGPRGPLGGYMLTSMCVWHLVHFHPSVQADSRFRYLGMSSKPRAHVIAFAQKPDAAREVARVGIMDPDMSGRVLLVLLQGLVWVDPDNFQILRAHTDMLAPRYDFGLARDTTEIDCSEIRFEGVDRSFWLPREALITSVYRGTTYRNRHRFSDYHLFTVESHDKVNPPVPP